MDLMSRRFAMMRQKVEDEELYPVGTDIIATYIRSDPNGWEFGSFDENGEYVQGGTSYASQIYIPVHSTYRYHKNAYRISRAVWYDKNKQVISTFRRYNTEEEDLPDPPANARYIRIGTFNITNMTNLKIIRIL